MDKAIAITRSRWDWKGDRWDGHWYDVKNHNCQDYIYDDTLKVYMGLGGVLYRKFFQPICEFIGD